MGGIFDPYFCTFFLGFLEIYPPKSEILGLNLKTGLWIASLHTQLAQFFDNENLWNSEKSNCDFLTVFVLIF